MNQRQFLIFLIVLAGCTISHPKLFENVKVSNDKSYGYTATNPVMIKNGSQPQSIDASLYYLSRLRTEQGEKLQLIQRYSVGNPNYKKGGIPLRDGSTIGGSGPLLDLYIFQPESGKDTIRIYVNTYEKDEVKVPTGLKFEGK
jgi:hypothetical protein